MPVKQAFTLIESLFCLSILSIMLFLVVPNNQIKSNYLDDFTYSQNIYQTQLLALTTKSKKPLYIDNKETSFSFNYKGNINQAGTLILGNRKCIFQLGSGRFYFE